MRKKEINDLLTRALKMLKMENCNFGDNFGVEEKSLPKTEKEVTAFIKSRIGLHHRTWIVPPIEQALKLINR